MSKPYDIVIVGGGPAGTSAAVTALERSLTVALLDRATFPRPKLCGGLLTLKTLHALRKVFGVSVNGLAKAGAVVGSAESYALYCRTQKLASGSSVHPFYLVDRTVFDAHLLDLARRAGAEVHEGLAVTDCSPDTGEVATAEGPVRGKWIIGADGATGPMRRTVGADPQAWRNNLADAVEVSIPRENVPRDLRDLDHPGLHVGYIPTGYGWVFPTREHLVIGMCGLRDPKKTITLHCREFLADLGIAPESASLQGHPLPYGNALDVPGKNRVLLAGDAGGFVEPTLGEGIFYAITTGRYAADACAEAIGEKRDPLAVYQQRLEKYVRPELRASNRMRWILMSLIRAFGHRALKLFMHFKTRKLAQTVHGLRSYRFLRKKSWD